MGACEILIKFLICLRNGKSDGKLSLIHFVRIYFNLFCKLGLAEVDSTLVLIGLI